jgi:peptidoglycan/LPS O-acetylase OafA/YrhL
LDQARRAERIDSLTGLRIVPAIVVLLSHVERPPGAGKVLRSFLTAGYCGVTMFFVLSGFVIAHNYFDRFKSDFSLKVLWSYVVARLARVYPLYLLVLLWVSVPKLLSGSYGLLWLRHALALQAWDPSLGRAYTFNGPGWSISVEFFFYAAFPLLVLVLSPAARKARNAVLALLLVVALIGLVTLWFVANGYGDLDWADPRSAHRWLYRNPLCRLGDFTVGVLAALLLAALRREARRDWRVLGNVAVAIGAGSFLVLMCWSGLTYRAASWDFAYVLPAALLILGLGLTPGSFASRALGTKPLLLLGEASYAVYLCHAWMLRHIHIFPVGSPSPWLVVQGCNIVLVLAVAIGLHLAFERPARQFVRWSLDPSVRRHRTNRVEQMSVDMAAHP